VRPGEAKLTILQSPLPPPSTASPLGLIIEIWGSPAARATCDIIAELYQARWASRASLWDRGIRINFTAKWIGCLDLKDEQKALKLFLSFFFLIWERMNICACIKRGPL